MRGTAAEVALFLTLCTLWTLQVGALMKAGLCRRCSHRQDTRSFGGEPGSRRAHTSNSLAPAVGFLGASLIAGASLSAVNRALWSPSRTYRPYENTVGREYDAWEAEGILEHYWGEHIHLGYYPDSDRRVGALRPPTTDFIQAKRIFIEEMLKFSKFHPPLSPFRILDVGCGIGGTSRFLAQHFGAGAQVTGITLSAGQARRANDLSLARGVANVDVQVMDALGLNFPPASFDLVWACESSEHMPDKQRHIEEMVRVLKPGGTLVIATWCQRSEECRPFSADDRAMLDFLYSEWAHPFFISLADYRSLLEGTGQLEEVECDDWTAVTLPSWLHSLWVGVFDPWPVLRKPALWWKCLRDGVTLARMHKSFKDGLMEYGMLRATKSLT